MPVRRLSEKLVRTDSGCGSREGSFDRPKSSNECPRGQFADGFPTGSDRVEPKTTPGVLLGEMDGL